MHSYLENRHCYKALWWVGEWQCEGLTHLRAQKNSQVGNATIISKPEAELQWQIQIANELNALTLSSAFHSTGASHLIGMAPQRQGHARKPRCGVWAEHRERRRPGGSHGRGAAESGGTAGGFLGPQAHLGLSGLPGYHNCYLRQVSRVRVCQPHPWEQSTRTEALRWEKRDLLAHHSTLENPGQRRDMGRPSTRTLKSSLQWEWLLPLRVSETGKNASMTRKTREPCKRHHLYFGEEGEKVVFSRRPVDLRFWLPGERRHYWTDGATWQQRQPCKACHSN